MQLSSSVGPVFYRFYTEKTCQSTLDWYQCFQSCCDYCWWDWSFVYILIAGCFFKVLQMCIVYCSLQLFSCLIWNVNNWCTSTNLIEVLLETCAGVVRAQTLRFLGTCRFLFLSVLMSWHVKSHSWFVCSQQQVWTCCVRMLKTVHLNKCPG